MPEPAPEVADALRRLQQAVAELLATRLPPGSTIRDAKQRLNLGQQLTWMILSFRRASTVADMIRFLPGRRGWDSLLASFAEYRGQTEPLERTRTALQAFRRICEATGLDPKTLVEPNAASETFESERYRREEFLKLRSTWPVWAGGKIVAYLVAPDRDHPELGSLTTVMMLLGLERSTPGPLLEVARSQIARHQLRGLLPPGTDLDGVFGCGGPLPPLLEAFSSPGVAGRELHRMSQPDEADRIGFDEVDPTRTSPLTLAFGLYRPRLGPLRGSPENRVVFAAETPGPVEWCVLDVLWPRDLPAGGPWSARLSCGSFVAGVELEMAAQLPTLIDPLESTRLDAIALPKSLSYATPNYREALEAAAAALGRSLEEFEIHRSLLRYSLPRTAIIASRPLALEPEPEIP